MRRDTLAVGALAALLFAIDRLYRVLHPVVDLERATWVGLTALAALAPLALVRRRPLEPWLGALSIWASAVGSVLLIEAGVLVSRSLLSGAVHLAILAAIYGPLERARRAGRLPFRRARA
jgi:hypothetical protein